VIIRLAATDDADADVRPERDHVRLPYQLQDVML
jgi:hypothetical protein